MRAVENNCEALQYQMFEDGEKAAFVQYHMAGNEMWILHTYLFRCFKSPEVVEALLSHVLEDARRSRISVAPFCPAMRVYIGAHPQYENLIPPAWRNQLAGFDPYGYSAENPTPLDYVRLTGSRRALLRVGEPVSPRNIDAIAD
ncbi:GNAT family N-acetyltransferase [Arthrobacter rhombi]|uniref:GNAT family N-acetyltransferase n=1 Tax=Arthrobacter rhombi TaxID=71253 RepID=UPI003FD6896B